MQKFRILFMYRYTICKQFDNSEGIGAGGVEGGKGHLFFFLSVTFRRFAARFSSFRPDFEGQLFLVFFFSLCFLATERRGSRTRRAGHERNPRSLRTRTSSCRSPNPVPAMRLAASFAAPSSSVSAPGARPTRSLNASKIKWESRRAMRGRLGASSPPSTSSPAWDDDDGGVVFSAQEIARVSEGLLVREGPRGSICTDR